MGWPFLWPADEPWPVCRQRNLDLASRMQAGFDRAELGGIDIDRSELGLPTLRETVMLAIKRHRDGHNAAYLPVLQLNRSEFPELPFPSDSDLFQLLWCPVVHFEGGGGYLLLWLRADTILEIRVDPPSPTVDGYRIIPCALDPERIDDYPERFEVTPPPIESLESEEDWWRTMEDSGPALGTKLFGFPNWVQSPEYPYCERCGTQMNLLITVSSREFGHSHSDNARWVPYEDRDILRTAPFDLRQEYDLPHDWRIGDGGDAYLFYCRECPGEFNSRVHCG